MSKISIYRKNRNPIWLTHITLTFLFIVVCLAWATTSLSVKIIVETIPPLMSSGLRFVIASPMFLILAWVRGEPILFPKKLFPFFVCITIFYFTLPYWLINISAQYVSPGLIALLFSTMPVFVLILSSIILKEKVFFSQGVGIAIGFLSLMMVVKLYLNLGYSNLTGVVLLLISALMQGFMYIFIKKLGTHISSITLHALPISIAGTLLTVLGFVFERPNFAEFSKISVLALIYLGCLTLIGTNIYFFLIKRMSLIVLSFVFIIFPALAVLLSAWYENMALSGHFLFYTLMLLIGFSITKFPIEKLIQKKVKNYK